MSGGRVEIKMPKAQGLEAYQKFLTDLKRKVQDSYVKVGIQGRKGAEDRGQINNVQLAAIHEFGTSAIPARPFIGPPIAAAKEESFALIADAARVALATQDIAVYKRRLGLLGEKLSSSIRAYVTGGAGVAPPNAPSTVRAKGSSRPLVDTGQMIRSVTYEVKS